MTGHVIVQAAVEGYVDEAVLGRVAGAVGAGLGTVYGKRGKHHLKNKIHGYCAAARNWPWVVLVDLDHDASCAPDLRQSWLPGGAHALCFRVAVRAVEAWLLADWERFSRFFGIPASLIPRNVEALNDPKGTVVELARQSRRSAVRQDMVPRPGSGRREGPLYTSRLIEFVRDTSGGWRPGLAVQRSDSLSRCFRALDRLVQELADDRS